MDVEYRLRIRAGQGRSGRVVVRVRVCAFEHTANTLRGARTQLIETRKFARIERVHVAGGDLRSNETKDV